MKATSRRFITKLIPSSIAGSGSPGRVPGPGIRPAEERRHAWSPALSWTRIAGALTLAVAASIARAGTITITLPPDISIVKAAATTEKEPKTTITGTIGATTVTFADPIPGSVYEAQLTLKDGTVLQGVDMGWYSRVPDKPDAGELTDGDRQQMKDVLTKVLSFYNVNEVTLLKGNHNRAVMLVRLQRDKAFHSDQGDEVIWRPELWYFQNDHGGWEKVLQTDRVLRRERFATQKDFHAVVDFLKWVPELGGLKATPKNPDVKVMLPANAGIPAVWPTTRPAGEQQ